MHVLDQGHGSKGIGCIQELQAVLWLVRPRPEPSLRGRRLGLGEVLRLVQKSRQLKLHTTALGKGNGGQTEEPFVWLWDTGFS